MAIIPYSTEGELPSFCTILHTAARGKSPRHSPISGKSRDIFLIVLGGLLPTMEATSRGAIPHRRILVMSKLVAWLRSLGPAGTLAANILVFVTTNWVTVMSLVTGLAVALWASAVSFFQEPAVQTGITIFLITLWTIVGVLYVYDRTKPRTIRVAPDYRYGITFEGMGIAIDPLNEETWFGPVLQLRNFSQAPIRYTVTQFDVRIGTRALPKPERPLTVYMARGAGRTSSPSKFSKDEMREFFGKRMKGTAEIVLVYGHPEEKPVRRLKLSFDLILHLPADGGSPTNPFGWGTDIISEVDEPIDVSTP